MPSLPPFLLLTRPERESRRFLAELAAERAEPLVSPLLDIVTTGPLPDLAGVRGLIFTSANGVRAYAALAGPPLSPCFVVGEATARAARDVGLVPVVAQGDAESLLALILDHAPEGPLLHLRGTFARGALAERLTAAGYDAGTPDGVLGKKTEAAISAYQRANGMAVTGEPSRALLARL